MLIILDLSQVFRQNFFALARGPRATNLINLHITRGVPCSNGRVASLHNVSYTSKHNQRCRLFPEGLRLALGHSTSEDLFWSIRFLF